MRAEGEGEGEGEDEGEAAREQDSATHLLKRLIEQGRDLADLGRLVVGDKDLVQELRWGRERAPAKTTRLRPRGTRDGVGSALGAGPRPGLAFSR